MPLAIMKDVPSVLRFGFCQPDFKRPCTYNAGRTRSEFINALGFVVMIWKLLYYAWMLNTCQRYIIQRL